MSTVSSNPHSINPSDMRVLAVGDDSNFLNNLEEMLEKCLYRVTKCSSAVDALQLLRENKDGFDIIMCEVHMPEMDGFELLECARLLMDIPFIMMSADESTSVIWRALARGACDYLIKPVSIQRLKTIWLKVILHKNAKRYDDSSAGFIWTDDIHLQFVDAVNQLGGVDKAIPGRILKLMNVPNLTMEYVAFHLHEYWLHSKSIRDGYVPNQVGSSTMTE